MLSSWVQFFGGVDFVSKVWAMRREMVFLLVVVGTAVVGVDVVVAVHFRHLHQCCSRIWSRSFFAWPNVSDFA